MLQGIMAVELTVLLWQGSWASAVWLLVIMAVNGAPSLLGARLSVHIPAGFVALFAFAFAVAADTAWEIFEFAVDQLLGTQMQKPMLGDPSGLTDTMWDLIVDAFGAAVICSFGWWHMKSNRPSFIEVWIDRFVERNPRLFRN